MDETKRPILQIAGTIPEKDYKAAARSAFTRFFLKYLAVYLLILFLLNLFFQLFQWLPLLMDGLPFSWFLYDFVWFLDGGLFTWLIFGIIALFGVYCIVIRPAQAVKQLRKLQPDGIRVRYDFYEEHLVKTVVTSTTEQKIRVKYADVRRKIRETRINIILPSVQQEPVLLYKTIMTPREEESVRALLKERCPQRRNGK